MKVSAKNRPGRHRANWRQTARDTAFGVSFALLVHALGVGLLWLGSLNWEPRREIAPPAFTLVDAAPFIEARRREQLAVEQQREADQRLEQVRREEARRQRELELQHQDEQQQQQAERERQNVLEQQRQQQLVREREQQQALEAQQQRQVQRELDQQRRTAEQQRLRELEQLRQQREQASREREEQERRLAELAEQRQRQQQQHQAEQQAERLRLAREQAEAEQREAGLRDEYVSTIAELVARNWIRPPTTHSGVRCAVRVVQIPGGEIIDQAIASPCNADEITKRSILSAVERAGVLPYRGYEDVFEREIVFNFRYDG
ncbi:MAG: TonB C-terminal domain-containing protein [Xanthomonadaceae bacterium]|nr:TonB C-terminal domain-containing protein [Xanthomonadaceae bacterium]